MKAPSRLLAVVMALTVAVAFAGPLLQRQKLLDLEEETSRQKENTVQELHHQKDLPVNIVSDCGKN